MKRSVLISRYLAFALLATIANLGVQRLVLAVADTPSFFVMAVVAGTLVGLVIKYLLDKRWVFFDDATGLKTHGQKFPLYAGMGLITTILFWVGETSFWWIWRTDAMREIGAFLGLSVGYVIKYNLDRRFVFPATRQGSTA